MEKKEMTSMMTLKLLILKAKRKITQTLAMMKIISMMVTAQKEVHKLLLIKRKKELSVEKIDIIQNKETLHLRLATIAI